MSRPALLALLWALAALTLARCIHRPPLRRAAGALLALAVASSVRHALPDRPLGWELRLDIVLSMAWPAAAAWLIAGPVALAWLAYAVALALWGRHLALHWTAALQLPRYAVGALATVGALRRGVWRSEPRAAAGAGGAPWTASQRVGLWLAAGQVVMVGADALERAAGVEGLWSRWGMVRALSAFFYGLCALVVLSEPRPR